MAKTQTEGSTQVKGQVPANSNVASSLIAMLFGK